MVSSSMKKEDYPNNISRCNIAHSAQKEILVRYKWTEIGQECKNRMNSNKGTSEKHSLSTEF
jgi:hypothetical protein